MEEKTFSSNILTFKWRVTNPFLPFRAVEVSFEHAFPSRMRWTAKLQPRYRSLEKWGFRMSLQCYREGDFAVVAEKIKIHISERERKIDEDLVSDLYVFHEENDHKFETCLIFISPGSLAFEFEVYVHFRERHWSDIKDLDSLSYDLNKVLLNDSYSEFSLGTEMPDLPLPVHACIMRARWPSLFLIHVEELVWGGTVTTGIHSDVLLKLLEYMYTGGITTSTNSHHRDELERVSETYGMRYLTQEISGSDLLERNVLRTINDLSIHPLEIAVDDNTGRVRGHLDLTEFQFDFEMSELGREFSFFTYRIELVRERSLHVRVDLGYRRDGRWIGILHEKDYLVAGMFLVESGHVPLEGHYPEFQAFLNRCRRGESLTDSSHKFVLTLYACEGARTEAPSLEEHEVFFDADASFSSLSDDIFGLLSDDPFDADVEVNCGGRIYRLNRAILAARMQLWSNVLQPAHEDEPPFNFIDEPPAAIQDDPGRAPDEAVLAERFDLFHTMPPRMRTTYSNECFSYVLSYIYSGKVFPLANTLRDEVMNFAREGRVGFLKELMMESVSNL